MRMWRRNYVKWAGNLKAHLAISSLMRDRVEPGENSLCHNNTSSTLHRLVEGGMPFYPEKRRVSGTAEEIFGFEHLSFHAGRSF